MGGAVDANPGPRRRLVAALLTWQFLQEFIPFFTVYALLFADHGLSTAQISLLLVVWSAVSVIAEVPSGAWADVLPRRALLAGSSVLCAGCFATWVLLPTPFGFALGFVFWGVSSSLSSGTFQALAYDELVAIGARAHYAVVIGRGTSLALVAVTTSAMLASGLMAIGGYGLTAWVSVAVCAAQLLVLAWLPESPRAISAADVGLLDDESDVGVSAAEPRVDVGDDADCDFGVRGDDAEAHRRVPGSEPVVPAGHAGVWGTWVATLRSGLRLVLRDRTVRGGVLASAFLMGLLAFDEYFGLLLREQGVPTQWVPAMFAIITGAQAVGGLVADRFAETRSRTLAIVCAVAAVVMAAGTLARHPIGVLGIAAGYGTLTMLIVVAEVRLQHVSTSAVRATVTSASAMGAEILAAGCYLVVGALTAWWAMGPTLAVLCLLIVVLASRLPRWLPDPVGD